ncbi:MAG: ATP-binding cassette domain-containing protein, partial [Candidatus Margulisbacteria bacterium]|nr:ATP-binding cassette domain-containing protein [Candidatus Margulisiibacteriota bacterium]
MYKLINIKRSYGENTVFEKVTLTFEKGKIYALVGENGAGKTTLLETIAKFEPTEEGSVSFADQKISFCLQKPHLFKTSVAKNIAYGLTNRGEKEPTGKVRAIAKQFGILHLLEKKSDQLSGGEAQKVALARTFILETPIILLDEPTANLDEESIAALEKLLIETKAKGITVILATHKLDLAYRLADEVITLHDQQAFPASSENFFPGTIIENRFKVNESFSFAITAEKIGSAKTSIDPKEIIVSKEAITSSARNCLKAKVSSIIDEGQV